MPSIESARSWYSQDDPVHGFDHVLRVYAMAERIARQEGGDLEIVRAAALLHDAYAPKDDEEAALAGDSVTGRKDHHLQASDFARPILQAEGWTEDRIQAVQHCIIAHRFRGKERPHSLEARILFDADKLDAIGALGVARAVAYAAVHGLPAYALPSRQFSETGKTEPGEPHSAYHEYLFKLRRLEQRLFTRTARQIAKERNRFMEQFFIELMAETEGER